MYIEYRKNDKDSFLKAIMSEKDRVAHQQESLIRHCTMTTACGSHQPWHTQPFTMKAAPGLSLSSHTSANQGKERFTRFAHIPENSQCRNASLSGTVQTHSGLLGV